MSQIKRLDASLTKHLDRRKSRDTLRSLTLVPPGMADFSSNAYLSLSAQPSVKAAFLARLQAAAQVPPSANPPPLLGSGGSRLLDGNSARAELLEQTLAAFHNAPAALLFNSAMDANVGLFSCVPQPDDVILYDELVHASIHDGMRLSRAGKKIPFLHNAVWSGEETASHVGSGDGEPRPLEAVLVGLLNGPGGHLFSSGDRNVFVAVEGVYSMDGDAAPLREVTACVERWLPQGNGFVVVDEAHSVGVFGDSGQGLVCELGLEDRVWARVLGFGKAMGCSGGTYDLHTIR
ncbi:pyridoxal phosphate-dependent transferase [Apiosordaria backusii]|uniref:Pyridoxal phosphate-dependent transferase n=1 Tax=Apiosordaria backusii TaxID=314023 RepID=A0AA40EGA9_9PEZI|nr:pyridoxal phosphate-dependent transferase [Apiosordaria backusii]